MKTRLVSVAGAATCLYALLAWSEIAFSQSAAEAAPSRVRIARLVKSLGSDSFAERDKAGEELGALGDLPRPELEEAVHDPDPEIRLRAKDLLRRLKVAELWLPAKISWQADEIPAAKAFAELGARSGNRVLLGEPYGAFKDATLAFQATDQGFWQLLDELCRLSGNRARPHYDTRTPGLIVSAGLPGKSPVAYSGPIRACVTAARRSFSEELRYDDRASDLTHTFQLDVQTMWEDRFRLVAYRSQPAVVRARTDTGVELPATNSAAGGWNVAHPGTRQVSMNLRLQPPPIAARELDVLELSWGLIAVGDMAQFKIDNLDSREPHFQDDVELTVEAVQTIAGGRCELTLVLNRDLTLPEPHDVLFQENEFELIDSTGKPYRRQGHSNSIADRGAVIKVSFMGEASDSQPAALHMTYPRIRVQRDLPIVFRHVPLPVGQPD